MLAARHRRKPILKCLVAAIVCILLYGLSQKFYLRQDMTVYVPHFRGGFVLLRVQYIMYIAKKPHFNFFSHQINKYCACLQIEVGLLLAEIVNPGALNPKSMQSFLSG